MEGTAGLPWSEARPILEDLVKFLDGLSDAYRRGKHPDAKEAKQVAQLLRRVAEDIVWAKLPALNEGARIASSRLFPKG